MNQRPDAWQRDFFASWLPPARVYRPSSIPPEFRWENEDLAIPRRADELDGLDNFLIFRLYF